MRPFLWALAVVVIFAPTAASAAEPSALRSLGGSRNNVKHPAWGRANMPYPRMTAARYADGKAALVGGPAARYVSNRIFNDSAQNLFSENGVTQWGAFWGQFLDHTFGLRRTEGGESRPLAFDAADPLEAFRNDFGAMEFERTPAVPGTGKDSPRQQLNAVGGYIDASAVYGDTDRRLRWLRRRDGTARLLLPGGYLPRAGARGNVKRAPTMNLMGRLTGDPARAVVAGDVRANENLALTATHTLFAREHNRIVGALPASLPADRKFQIARRVVGAVQQHITYAEWLPALGVALSPYKGYKPHVNAGITNEFATVGFRAHSMIHGELEPIAHTGAYAPAERAAFAARGIEVELEDGGYVLVVPLNLGFGNPGLLPQIGLGPLLRGLGGEPQYKNDEQIDNQLRSVLFEVPRPGTNPMACLDGPTLAECFHGVADLAAIDIKRGRDHGMPSYNGMRRAYGLQPKTSFTAITGEATDQFPADPELDPSNPLGDPDSLDFVSLRDGAGAEIALGSAGADGEAVSGTRRTTLAARLRGIYGDVERLDAFVGMSAEMHLPGSEFGELQLAMWKKQFEDLRDGDRFFFRNDPGLMEIERRYGIGYKRSLARVIEQNTDEQVEGNVFKAAD